MGIVARLGGFDTLITYLGGIGKIMKGSGIEELFNEVYPENTVQHIISGKDVSRALQAHPGKRFQKFPDVNLKEDIVIPFTREKFLSNSNNKVQLIKMLSQYLKDDGNEFFNCSGDADSTICHTARDLATTVEKEVVLIADDIYFYRAYLSLEVRNEKYHILQTKNAQKLEYCILIPKARQSKNHTLFVHAMTGCDTTSAPNRKGKKSFLDQR